MLHRFFKIGWWVCFTIILGYCLTIIGVEPAQAAVLTLPSGVKTIEAEAFFGDTSLDEVVLPSGIKKIGDYAFANSSIKKINLPKSLTTISNTAFNGAMLSQITANWDTLGSKWAIEHMIKLVTPASSMTFTPVATLTSAGNSDAMKGTDVSNYINQCFTAHDVVGGWFKFVAPTGGKYTFSVKASSVAESFKLHIYATRNGSWTKIKEFTYDKNNNIVTYVLPNVVAGETIYWWDGKTSNTGYTAQSDFLLRIAEYDKIAPVLIPVSGITISRTSCVIYKGETETLTAAVLPGNASNKQVTWSSTDTNVATVTNGVVTAKKVGNATIIVETVDGSYVDSCEITVLPRTIWDTTPIVLNLANDERITITQNYFDKLLTLKGYQGSWGLKFPSDGYYTIQAWNTNKTTEADLWLYQDTCIQKMAFAKNSTEPTTYQTEVFPAGTDLWFWLAADNNGSLIFSSGLNAVFTFHAKAMPATKVSSITINNTDDYSFKFGQTKQLTAAVAPSNATNKAIRWVRDSGTDGITINEQTGLVTAQVGGRIKVHAEALDGSGVVSDAFWVYCIPNKVPTLQVDRVGYKTIQLSWDQVPGAVEYRVSYKASSLDEWTVTTVEGPGNNSLTLKYLRNKTNNPNHDDIFQVKIQAASIHSATKSRTEYSAVKNVNLLTKNDVEKPSVSVKSYTSSSVTLSLAPVGNNTEYFCIDYYANKVDGEWQIEEEIEDIPANIGTYTITGLPANTKVYFDVMPETWDEGIILDVWSSTYVTTKTGANAPNPPTSVSAAATGSETLNLTWTASSNADGYYVRRSSTTATPVQVSGRTSTSYSVSGLNPNTEYRFYVSAYKSTSSGIVESERVKVTGTTSSVSLGKVTGVNQTAYTANTISLSWNAVTNAKTYEVFWHPVTASSTTWFSKEVNAPTTSCTITGLVADNSYEICVVAVKGTARGTQSDSVIMSTKSSTVAVTGVSLNVTSSTLTAGGNTLWLSETILPSNATNKSVIWTSSNTSVATISNGLVTPVSAGTATITVKTVDGNKTATCQVKVVPNIVSVTGVSLNKHEMTIMADGSESLVATVSPTNASDKNVIWTTTNDSVATVSNGIVTAKNEGIAVITVISTDGGYNDTCIVTVTPKPIAVTGIRLNKSSIALPVGSKETLIATILPANAANKSVTWTSSNDSVATVQDGVVTFRAVGNATITVKTVDGNYKATCSITVQTPPVNAPVIESATVSKNKITINWSPVSGATVYTVYMMKGDTGTPSEIIKNVDGSLCTCSIANLDKQTTYRFAVTATVSGNETGKSNVINATTENKDGIVVGRALLVSESTFNWDQYEGLFDWIPLLDRQEYTIYRNQGDVLLIKDMLATVKTPSGRLWNTPVTIDNATNQQIKDNISSTFRNADDDDISLFMIATHGDIKNTGSSAGYLCTYYGDTLELGVLAGWLENIPGKVVVFLESCGSGAAIYSKSSNTGTTAPGMGLDPQLVIRAFSSVDHSLIPERTLLYHYDEIGEIQQIETIEITPKTGEFIYENKFYVLTASDYQQVSYSMAEDYQSATNSYNLFPYYICDAIGPSGMMPADSNNSNTLSLNELYKYVYNKCKSKQTTKVYPTNCGTILFKR